MFNAGTLEPVKFNPLICLSTTGEFDDMMTNDGGNCDVPVTCQNHVNVHGTVLCILNAISMLRISENRTISTIFKTAMNSGN